MPLTMSLYFLIASYLLLEFIFLLTVKYNKSSKSLKTKLYDNILLNNGEKWIIFYKAIKCGFIYFLNSDPACLNYD